MLLPVVPGGEGHDPRVNGRAVRSAACNRGRAERSHVHGRLDAFCMDYPVGGLHECSLQSTERECVVQ